MGYLNIISCQQVYIRISVLEYKVDAFIPCMDSIEQMSIEGGKRKSDSKFIDIFSLQWDILI